MFGKSEKKHSGSMEPVEGTGNIWRKKILGMWNGWKLGISRVTEKKHSGNAELVEETGDVWENRRKHSENVEPVGGKLGMSGKREKNILRMRNWWKLGISRITEKKHSGNMELAEETGDV